MHWQHRTRRRPSYNEPGHAHELTFCCLHRYRFLAAERTCLWLADAISEASKKHNFSVWAYVFMPDHVHIVVYPHAEQYRIDEILSGIKEPTGRAAISYLRTSHPDWMRRLTVKKGKRTETRFWQPGGGYDRNIIDAKTLVNMIEYIHLNPLRKQLVMRVEDWKWSSAGWFAGLQPNTLKPDPIPPEWGVVE